MAGFTRLERICNQDFRQRFGVASITDKLQEVHLRWYDHVLRADNDSVCEIGFILDLTGKRPKGRLKQRWMNTLHVHLKAVGMHPDQAHDRIKWRQGINKADPPPPNGTNAEEEDTSQRHISMYI
ncbi:hypothetical protein Y032_0169g222 [Ancylostoma ceylanicum]|uniref:Uncharacterized protein n=1 Tax=Ancylostoma ceylanicum TaxID=53326 RepID=A0A016SW70_9BILA|nr:hypothetical protein Y032_0169g222 [Ancylostoma ceylanicum]